MDVPNELLVELVKRVAGNDTVRLFEVLNKRRNVSEFKIAEKLDISVNQVRNMIYRLQEHNLVSFTRKKDKVKGWYIYYWTFERPKAVELIVDMKTKETKDDKYELENIEDTRYYLCKYCRTKLGEEESLELQFLCEGCGEILEEQDANKRKKELIKKLKKDEEYLKAAKEALDHHRMLVGKATDRRLVKEKAEKDKLRAEARKAKALELEKTNKKAPKKVKKVPKKTVKKVKGAPKKNVKKSHKKVKKGPKKVRNVSKKTVKKVLDKTIQKPKKKGILGRVFKK